MKPLRYWIGLILLAVLLGIVLFADLPSMLKWQSEFVSRAFLFLLVCSLFCLFRIYKGPTPGDRIVAVDILGILIVGFCAVLSLATGRTWYIDIAIAWALQSFIGALALAKYLEGRGFDE